MNLRQRYCEGPSGWEWWRDELAAKGKVTVAYVTTAAEAAPQGLSLSFLVLMLWAISWQGRCKKKNQWFMI